MAIGSVSVAVANAVVLCPVVVVDVVAFVAGLCCLCVFSQLEYRA